ncbi:MAG: flagellar biosynthetic protein FliO [Pseudomonadota bacterium]
MFDWLTGIVGEDTAPIATYALIFVLLLVGLLLLRFVLRQMRGGTFVNGGHGRKKRLAVIDATPVDNRRRLVLVRRDDVEHLVLIGGMNDLVVERDIDAQSTSKTESPAASPVPKPDQNKKAVTPEPVDNAPPPEPKTTPIAKVSKPTPVVEASKVEPPAQRKVAMDVESPEAPAATPKMAAAAAVSNSAAAIVGAANTQTENLKSAATEAVEQVQKKAIGDAEPASPIFSAYMEQEKTEPAVESYKPEPAPSVDEFMPIGAKEQSLKSTEDNAPLVEPESKEEDSDLEDEMEQLLNKLTSPSQS